jgi:hypothetical protein
MTYRLCPDESWLAFATIDTPEMVETEAVVERGERHLKLLAELADLGMELARKIVRNADTLPGVPPEEHDTRKPPADPAKAFSTIAQAVRRTVALEAKLAEDVKTLRGGLLAARAERGANLMRAQSEHTAGAVRDALAEVLEETFSDLDCDEARGLLRDADELLRDRDEFNDFLDRPPGETIARLCATLGLDPEFCVQDGDTWMLRRPPYTFQTRQEEKRGSSAETAAAGCSP